MPLINHVRGDQVPDSMLNVRTPVVKIPLWMALTWWTVKGLVRLVWLYLRFWYASVPTTILLWLYARYGWFGPVGLLVGLSTLAGTWFGVHRASFERQIGRAHV